MHFDVVLGSGLQAFSELQAALLDRKVKARKTVNAKKETVVKSVLHTFPLE